MEENNNMILAQKWEEESETTQENRIKTKECKCCGRTLPISDFYVAAHNRDGLQTCCKECSNKKRRENRELAARRQQETRLRTELQQFAPRELIEYLASIGYRGTLTYTETHEIKL